MIITVDKLFSYWVFMWFIIYYFGNKYIGYNVPTPKLALYIAFYENIAELISLMTVNLNWWLITKFSIMILFVKLLPLYLLRNEKIEIKDIYILLVVFSIYVIYLYLLGTSLLEVYKTTNKSLAEGKNDTPFYIFIDWISKIFSNK
jgi:hypothetical protein